MWLRVAFEFGELRRRQIRKEERVGGKITYLDEFCRSSH
jgi:hypothetical protein